MGKGVVHFFVGFLFGYIRILYGLIFGKHVFLKCLFLHRLWTTLAAIGSVNITWWKLDILPGYLTTPNPAEENSMKKGQQVKIKIKI